jgi:hypothetical protein
MSRESDHEESRRAIRIGRREATATAGAALLAALVGIPAAAKSVPPSSRDDLREAQRFERERKYAPTRSGRIAYVERGEGAALLLLHGFRSTGINGGGHRSPVRATQVYCAGLHGTWLQRSAQEQSVSLGARPLPAIGAFAS